MIEIDSTVTQNRIVLTASAISATYQWINCNGNAPIANADSSTFTPNTNGSYAVIITRNGCFVTSVCSDIFTVGIAENAFDAIKLYPNPTRGNFVIDLGVNSSKTSLKITD